MEDTVAGIGVQIIYDNLRYAIHYILCVEPIAARHLQSAECTATGARAVSGELSADEAGEQLLRLFGLHDRAFHLVVDRAGRKASAPAAGQDEVGL